MVLLGGNKMKIRKLSNRLLSFALVGNLLIGSTVTSFAAEKPVPVTGVQWINDNIKDNMDSAEAAAQAAELAAQAAEAAAQAAQAAADAINLNTDISGNTVNDLINNAEQATNLGTVSENINVLDSVVNPALAIAVSGNEYIADQETAITVSVNQANTDAQVESDKATIEAEKAADALVIADAALEEAKLATNYIDAQAAADDAKEAYNAASLAAANAGTYYDNATKILADAQAAYDAAVLAANGEIGIYKANLEAAIVVVEEAFTDAQAAVTLVQEAYDNALKATADVKESAKKAQDAANLAKDSSDIVSVSSNNIDKVVKEPVEADIENAKRTVSNNEIALKSAEDNKSLVDAAQKLIINSNADAKAEAETALANVQSQLNAYNSAKTIKEDLEYTGIFQWTSDINKAKDIVKEGLGHKNWLGLWVGNTQADLNNANNKINKYNAAIATMESLNKTSLDSQKSSLNSAITTATKNITAANTAKTAANVAVTNAQNALTTAKAAQKILEDYLATFNYTDEATAITYTDKENKAQYKALLDEMIRKSDSYNEIYNDTAQYQWATADVGFWEGLGGIFTGSTWKKWFDELGIEGKYHGWTTQNGTYVIIKNNKDNTSALLLIKGDRAVILEKEQGELASYVAMFDKIAAAQAAAKAADAAEAAAEAAQTVLDAQARLTAAQKALNDAKDKLKEAKINDLNVENAEAILVKVQLEVNAASNSYELAKVDQEASFVDYQEAQKIADSFIVTPTTPSTPSNTNTTTTTTTASQKAIVEVIPLTTVITDAPVALASTPAARTTNVRATTVIEEETTPLVATMEETKVDDATDDADVIEENKVIADEEAPLAAELVENSFNWWWLLRIAAFVTAASFGGYQYYKKSKKNVIDKTSNK